MNFNPFVCAAGGAVLQCSFDRGLCDWMSDGGGDVRWEIGLGPAGMIVTQRGSSQHCHLVACVAHSETKWTQMQAEEKNC